MLSDLTDRLATLLAKAERLTVAELRARLVEKYRTLQERFFRPEPPPEARLSTDALLRLVPGASGATRQALLERPDLHERISARVRRRVEQITAGRLPLLFHPVDLAPPVDWHRDPVTGYRWTGRFYADIDTHARHVPDVKYVWELNRHQFFFDLAADWWLHVNEESAERLREYLLSWIDANPPYLGVNWTSALEVAVRAISWLWSLALLRDWKGFKPEHWRKIAAALAAHGFYLENHLSFFYSPFNHLIGELTGLYLIGRALRGGIPSNRWCSVAGRGLLIHAARQYGPDGFTVEQAVGYHFFTTGFLSLAFAAARAFGDRRLAAGLEPVLRRAYRAGAAFAGPDGNWPAIGDVDLARSIPVVEPEPEKFWDFRSLCNLGALLLDDANVSFPDAPYSEEAFWLCGDRAVGRLETLIRGRNRTLNGPLRALHLAGPPPIIKRAGKRRRVGYAHYFGRFLLDCAPIAGGLYSDDTPSAAHGHRDLLQVLVWLNGKPVLVDAGMTSYRPEHPLFLYQRTEEGHNTLRIEGCEPATYAGGLAWSRTITEDRLSLRYFFSDEIGVASGTVCWPGVGRITRTVISARPDEVWVIDAFAWRRPRRVEWFWHFAGNEPAAPASGDNGRLGSVGKQDSSDSRVARHGRAAKPLLRISVGHANLWVWGEGWREFTSAVDRPSDSGSQHKARAGYRSLGYGHAVPGKRLRFSGHPARNRTVVVTCIASRAPQSIVRVEGTSFGTGASHAPCSERGFSSPLLVEVLEGSNERTCYAVGGAPGGYNAVARVSGAGEIPVFKCRRSESLAASRSKVGTSERATAATVS